MDRNEEVISSGGFTPRILTYKSNAEHFARALQMGTALVEQNQARMDAVFDTLSKLELHPSEAPYLKDYADRINARFREAASKWSFNETDDGTDSVRGIAREVALDPILRGKERYNKEREEQLKVIRARRDNGKINPITVERWEEENKYNPNIIYDENNNAVGIDKFNPAWTPVDYVAYDALAIEAAQTTAAHSGRGTKNDFYDSEGRPVAFYNQRGVVSSKQSNQYEYKSSADMFKMARALYDAHNAWPSIEQDYKDDVFELNKLDTQLKNMSKDDTNYNVLSAKKEILEHRLKDPYTGIIPKNLNDNILTNYALNRHGDMIPNMAYNNNFTDLSYSGGTSGGNRSGNGAGSDSSSENFLSRLVTIMTKAVGVETTVNEGKNSNMDGQINETNNALKQVEDMLPD